MQALLLALTVAGLAGLVLLARRQHAAAMAERGKLLEPLRHLLAAPKTVIGPDGFPTISGHLRDGRPASFALIVDTLVTRRLPQLWLAATVGEAEIGLPIVGALARPVGTEFYSRTLGFADRLHVGTGLPHSLMVRGDDVPAGLASRLGPALARLFTDPTLKEVATTRRGIRVVRQAAEGERGAHLLRQVRFAQVPGPDMVLRAIADADMFREALREPALEPVRLSA